MKNSKKTLVLGASNNPARYSYRCVYTLLEHGHEVIPFGIKKGKVAGLEIVHDKTAIKGVDTLTLYLGLKHQEEYYDYILNVLKPKRIIFNPGAENPELRTLAEKNGIHTEEACTLVLLSTGQF